MRSSSRQGGALKNIHREQAVIWQSTVSLNLMTPLAGSNSHNQGTAAIHLLESLEAVAALVFAAAAVLAI